MKKRIYYIVTSVLGISLIVAAFYIFRYKIPVRLIPGQFTTGRADIGPVLQTGNAEGIVVPENEVFLRSPSGGVIKKILKTPGSMVKPGEIILLIDTEPIQKEIESTQDQLAVMKNNTFDII